MARILQVEHPGGICKSEAGGMNMTKPLTDTFPKPLTDTFLLVIQERDGNNLPKVTYTRGRDLSGSLHGAGGIGGLLARTSNSDLPSVSAHAYYHADGNGN